MAVKRDQDILRHHVIKRVWQELHVTLLRAVVGGCEGDVQRLCGAHGGEGQREEGGDEKRLLHSDFK